MRLELHKIHITGLAFANKTHTSGGTLFINKNEAEALIAEDKRFAKVELDLACPGESTRIIPVKDVIEPRVKIGKNSYFPGFFAKKQKRSEKTGSLFVIIFLFLIYTTFIQWVNRKN